MKNLHWALALVVVASQFSAVCANNQHANKPLPASNSQRHTLFPHLVHTAGVVEYTSSSGTGLSAVFVNRVYIDGYPHHGYQLTDNANGVVGWNIPSNGQPSLNISGFFQTSIDIASQTNFGSNPPFKVVAQTSDGVNHVCSGGQGTYDFFSNGGRSFSTYTANAGDFSPAFNAGDVVSKIAYIYQGGNGTVSFADPYIGGSNIVLYSGSYAYSLSNQSSFNFQN